MSSQVDQGSTSRHQQTPCRPNVQQQQESELEQRRTTDPISSSRRTTSIRSALKCSKVTIAIYNATKMG
ncbi:hypothetical protein AWZ03_002075 [Drosophila navojoa]|uniref:Uncharacterized protein n=1 Tax=Drosophila navojoa TaxID=7232 RepID=A0A484BUQ9_DRONA|nr:hypothetical protein AWZ03_002075 [Drosophila navojoa]